MPYLIEKNHLKQPFLMTHILDINPIDFDVTLNFLCQCIRVILLS